MELREIQDTVRTFAAKEIPQSHDLPQGFPDKLWQKIGESGLAGINVPESYGGIALDPVGIMTVMEEIAKVNTGPSIFLGVHSMVCGIISKFGNESQKKKFLPKLATGEMLGAFALTEPQAGSDASKLKSFAEKTSDGFNLNGEKCYITSAGSGQVYIVFAKTKNDGDPKKSISAFILEAPVDGLTISNPEKKMGCEMSPIASLYFSNIKLASESLIGELNDGYKVALSGLAGGRINIAACANGISHTAIEFAKKHLLEREQFGQKLANFQGLQFMIADMVMQYEAAKLLTINAAEELRDKKESRLKASLAKCYATDAAMKITTDAVQLLGGAGYLKEYTVERLMRDAKMLQIVEGTNQIQRMVIAREVFS